MNDLWLLTLDRLLLRSRKELEGKFLAATAIWASRLQCGTCRGTPAKACCLKLPTATAGCPTQE